MLQPSNFKPYLILAITLFINLFSLQGNSADSLNARNILGKPSPNFSLSDIKGQKVSFKQWRGKKVVLINFWATWCLPCVKEIPMLNKFQKRYAEDDLQIVGIAIDNATAINQFTQKIPIHYPNLIGNAQLILKFGNRTGSLPYTVIVDQQGNIVETASGMLTETYLQRAIEKQL